MARKPVESGGKKDEIIAAALELFMEKGYANTSIRMIQSKVGSEVGLFYYYFKDKDAVFEQALNLFFESYKKEFAQIVEQGRRNPSRLLTNFFVYMEEATDAFREQYAAKLHWTVRRAIREQMLEVIEPYLREIMDILVSYGARPKLDLDVAAMFLTHGVGSIILHEEKSVFKEKSAEVTKGINLIMGLDPNTAEMLFPKFATKEDIPGCMKLVEKVEAFFPGMQKDVFENQLKSYIEKGEAVVTRLRGEVEGLVLFSKETKSIDFLGRNPEYPHKGIGMRLLETAIAQFPIGEEISVITFREEDPKGMDARRLYSKFGFETVELLTMFEYPCEKMQLTVAEIPSKVGSVQPR
ncbi:MAG: GNAT family N-acetyltransferase [Lachnospiraceae bacterium]|nr:GNAT family N-acetyltransferase [Lachnospiraceae bacterium]